MCSCNFGNVVGTLDTIDRNRINMSRLIYAILELCLLVSNGFSACLFTAHTGTHTHRQVVLSSPCLPPLSPIHSLGDFGCS